MIAETLSTTWNFVAKTVNLLPLQLPDIWESKAQKKIKSPKLRQLDFYSCGSVATIICLEALEITSVSDRYEIWRSVDASPITGTETKKIRDVLRSYDAKVKSVTKKLSFIEIKKAISQGKLIIVCLYQGEDVAHWTVIYGYDKNNIYLRNNDWGEGKMTYREFNKLDLAETLIVGR